MGRVYITDYINNPDIERRILGNDLTMAPSPDVEVLLVWHQKIDSAYIQQFPKLKGVIRYGVGYDNLNLELLKERGIIACNTPDYGTSEVSDTALAMILNITRGVNFYNSIARRILNGTWQENVNTSLRRSSELTIGVVGAGRIGSALLRKAEALGFKTVFYDPYREDGYEKIFQKAKRYESLEGLLSESDLVSLHVPLNEETRGMVDKNFLMQMRPGSSLINTARGGLLADLDAILDSMKSGHLYSIAFDVLPEEPPSTRDALVEIWRRDSEMAARLIINPHTAYYSVDSFVEMRSKAAANAQRILTENRVKYRLV